MKNKLRDILIRISSFWFFYRWHPEVALRYLPIVSELRKMDKKTSILEVGSAGLGICPYLKREVTGVDIEFKPPFHFLLKKIKASATKLPFKTSSFEAVLSVDMLEHLRIEERERAIDEMIRVGKKKIFIGVPTGKNSFKQDKKLDEYYMKKFGKRFVFLEEQVNYGLPKKGEINDIIIKAGFTHHKKLNIKILGNENLPLREFLMKGWMTRNFLAAFFFRKVMLLFIPILENMNKEPTYRTLFFVDIL